MKTTKTRKTKSTAKNAAPISYSPGMYLYNPQIAKPNQHVQDAWQPSYHWLISQCSDIIYTCMHLRANNVAKAEPVLYQRVSQTKYRPVYNQDNAVIRLFDEPQKNTDITWHDLLYKSTLNKDGFGNSYWYFKRSKKFIHPDTGLGVPIEAFVLNIYENTQMEPIRNSNNNIVKWEYYPYGKNDGEKYTYDANDILHFKTHSLENQFYGKGILAASKEYILLRNSIQEYQKRNFAKDFPQKLILSSPNDYDPDAMSVYRDMFQKVYGGYENENAVITLWGGMEAQFANFSPKEADYLETLKFNLTQILGMFQIPPTMVSIFENANRALDVNSYRNWLNIILHTIIVDYDHKISKFIQRNFDRNLYVEHKIKMPADEKLDLERVRTLGALGVLKVNEAREKGGFDEAMLLDGSPDPVGEMYVNAKDIPSATRPGDGGETEAQKQP